MKQSEHSQFGQLPHRTFYASDGLLAPIKAQKSLFRHRQSNSDSWTSLAETIQLIEFLDGPGNSDPGAGHPQDCLHFFHKDASAILSEKTPNWEFLFEFGLWLDRKNGRRKCFEHGCPNHFRSIVSHSAWLEHGRKNRLSYMGGDIIA